MQKNKSSYHTVKQSSRTICDNESDEEHPTALMAVRGARPLPVKKVGSPPPGWTFESGQDTLAGGDKKFVFGTLKGETFTDVTFEHPQQ